MSELIEQLKYAIECATDALAEAEVDGGNRLNAANFILLAIEALEGAQGMLEKE